MASSRGFINHPRHGINQGRRRFFIMCLNACRLCFTAAGSQTSPAACIVQEYTVGVVEEFSRQPARSIRLGALCRRPAMTSKLACLHPHPPRRRPRTSCQVSGSAFRMITVAPAEELVRLIARSVGARVGFVSGLFRLSLDSSMQSSLSAKHIHPPLRQCPCPRHHLQSFAAWITT